MQRWLKSGLESCQCSCNWLSVAIGVKSTNTQNKPGLAKEAANLDDDEGHLIYEEGDLIDSNQSQYEIVRTVGEGTFGKVVECSETRRGEEKRIALKIIKNVSKYRDAAKLEINVLTTINEKDPMGENHCVRMLDWFDHKGHICISFEMLGLSVFDFLKDNDYRPYEMDQAKHIAYQLCDAVKFLHDNQLTHTDLKPENILFVNSDFEVVPCPKSNTDFRKVKCTEIRLIDFGSATFDTEHHSTVVSTRHYRAPEVILDIGWSQPCDVWSIGCILFELYSGRTLFQTHDNRDHLSMMEQILGVMPDQFKKALKKLRYFSNNCQPLWYEDYRIVHSTDEKCRPLMCHMRSSTELERHLFDLIRQQLEYDQNVRIKIDAVLAHPYFHRGLKRDSASFDSHHTVLLRQTLLCPAHVVICG